MSIAYVDIRFFVHATEDPNKVVAAVHHILPPNFVEKVVFKQQTLRGHYGNPITLFQTEIRKKEIVNVLVTNLSENLTASDKEKLCKEMDRHLEGGSLYIRLDKQAAFLGKLKLCSADPIRLRIRFKKRRREDLVAICRKLGILP